MSQNKNATRGIGVIVILLAISALISAMILINLGEKSGPALQLEKAQISDVENVI